MTLPDYAPRHTGNIGLLGFLAAAVVVVAWKGMRPVPATILLLLGATVPMIAHDLLVARVYRATAAGLLWDRPRSASFRRVVVKLLGFWATVGVAAVAYAMFAEYRKDNYQVAFAMMSWSLLGLVPVAPLYFWWVDGRQAEPRDGFWHAGMCVLGRWRQVNRDVLRQHGLGWLVKAFYLPLMLGFLVGDVQGMQSDMPDGKGFLGFVGWSSNVIYTVDLLFGTIGYVMTFRLLNSQIRSTEPTALGWTSAIMCYQPFWVVFDSNFLHYQAVSWFDFLPAAQHPVIHMAWGSALLLTEAIYTYATVCFGLRFSNLTHRGIIRTGLYSFTKHPAYVAKILSYLLVAVPFVTVGRHPWQALKQCLLLVGVAAIYRVRAVTEERHLMRDPAYRAYAEEIRRKHARWATKIGLGFLYRQPRTPEAAS